MIIKFKIRSITVGDNENLEQFPGAGSRKSRTTYLRTSFSQYDLQFLVV